MFCTTIWFNLYFLMNFMFGMNWTELGTAQHHLLLYFLNWVICFFPCFITKNFLGLGSNKFEIIRAYFRCFDKIWCQQFWIFRVKLGLTPNFTFLGALKVCMVGRKNQLSLSLFTQLSWVRLSWELIKNTQLVFDGVRVTTLLSFGGKPL